jgi:hypothetical protein
MRIYQLATYQFSLCSLFSISRFSPFFAPIPDIEEPSSVTALEHITTYLNDRPKPKRKYRPVSQKVHSIIAKVPEKFRIIRNIIGDPLSNIPVLNPNPPLPVNFRPTDRYTLNRCDQADRFLLPAKCDLMHNFMQLQDKGFVWNNSERSSFHIDFFAPIEFPLVPHMPWVIKNIPIPPGIYNEVCAIIKKKINAGIFEPSNSSYRTKWFVSPRKVVKVIYSSTA